LSQAVSLSILLFSIPGIKPLVSLLFLLWGKDETPDIEDPGSVLRDSSIQTLRLPT
jgi:hypothetical protein